MTGTKVLKVGKRQHHTVNLAHDGMKMFVLPYLRKLNKESGSQWTAVIKGEKRLTSWTLLEHKDEVELVE